MMPQQKESMKVRSVFSDREELAGLLTARYRLVLPISLRRSVEGARHFVSDGELNCWGEGASLDEARVDYEANLVEIYEDLSSSSEPLSRLATERLDTIRRHLVAA